MPGLTGRQAEFVPARTAEAHHFRHIVIQREIRRVTLPAPAPLTGDPDAEDPWFSYQPGTFPYPDDLAAAGGRPAA